MIQMRSLKLLTCVICYPLLLILYPAYLDKKVRKMKNPYANIPASMWLLATVTLISRSGSMVLVFLPLYLTQKLGFDIIVTGQIVSLYGLGEIAGSYLGGVFTDRFGALKIQALGFFLVGFLYILLEFLITKSTIMACMFFVGLFIASIRPATGASISKLCTPDIRARAYALNYQAVNFGAAIGPAIGGILASISYMWIFRLDGTASILAAIALWVFFSSQFSKKSQQIDHCNSTDTSKSAWTDKHFLIFLLLITLTGICFFQILNIYPLYLSNNYHLTTFEIGMIMGCNGILILLFQMILSNALRKYNTIRIISVGGVLICLGYLILPWYSGFYYALFSMSIITIGEMLLMPFSFEIVTKMTPVTRRGQYLGLLACAVSSVPLLITPNLMPYIYSTFGPTALWSSMGIIGVIIYIGFEYLNKTSLKLLVQM